MINNIQLINKNKLLPIENQINANLSAYSVYEAERKNCNKLRLTCNINTICSNVLFNNITEVVKDEGSDNVICLNFLNDNSVNSGEWGSKIVGKTFSDFINKTSGQINQAIRDTQLSKDVIGFKYHCGLDIFNNHILRSKTFKIIGPDSKRNNKDFNTISDIMRDYYGTAIKGYTLFSNQNSSNLHVYNFADIDSFENCVKDKLIEKDGWFGFQNNGKMSIYSQDDTINPNYDYFNVINYRNSCEFIDLTPERDLLLFVPKYNPYRNRVEKNWNFCLTYPSSSTTKGISFINDETNSLKIMYFDDEYINRSGNKSIKIFSVSKHGLISGDTVNLYNHYKNENTNETINELIVRNANVTEVIDEYTYVVTLNGEDISSQWYHLNENDIYTLSDGKGQYADCITVTYNIVENGVEKQIIRYFQISSDRNTFREGIVNDDIFTVNDDDIVYYFINKEKVNIDKKFQNLSFKKLLDGYEVEYYVRIFSKIPNWKFLGKTPTLDDLNSDTNLIKKYQQKKYEFSNSVSDLSFSRNIFNDKIGCVIFTDDIDISNLRDNLNRPLTDIYLTIIKNNKGYKQWYGKNIEENENQYDINLNDEFIEYSHCFGKVSCAFELSLASLPNLNYNNVRCINNIEDTKSTDGLYTELINERDENVKLFGLKDEICYNEEKSNVTNEIVYDGDINFYGDLCCYSEHTCYEQVIQNIDYRFNTAQREVISGDKTYNFLNKLFYEEIVNDDYDNNDYKVEVKSYNDANIRKEGYFYNPHFKIPIHTFSTTIQTQYPNFLYIKDIKLDDSKENYQVYDNYNKQNDEVIQYYEIFTLNSNEFKLNDIITIYSTINNQLYDAIIYEIINNRRFKIQVKSKIGELMINREDKNKYRFFKKDETIPSYAHIVKDGTCRFYWRDIIPNGFDEYSNITSYPFTNNVFNINRNFNLYLKRQDYDGLANMRELNFPNEPENNTLLIKEDNENKYYNESEIVC